MNENAKLVACVAVALVVCAVIVACAWRYEVVVSPHGMPVKTDRWTGQSWIITDTSGPWLPIGQ